MIYVVPAILEKDRAGFETRLEALRPFFNKAQIDVLNDSMIEVNSFADAGVLKEKAGGMKFEMHLMVNLDGYDLGQWNLECVEKIAIHVEATGDIAKAIAQIKSFEKKVFLAINPDSELNELSPFLKNVDGVMFMTVEPGAMGSMFLPYVVEKIAEFHKKHPKLEIEADGGISDKTIKEVVDAGVNEVAVGSYLQNDKLDERSVELISIIESR